MVTLHVPSKYWWVIPRLTEKLVHGPPNTEILVTLYSRVIQISCEDKKIHQIFFLHFLTLSETYSCLEKREENVLYGLYDCVIFLLASNLTVSLEMISLSAASSVYLAFRRVITELCSISMKTMNLFIWRSHVVRQQNHRRCLFYAGCLMEYTGMK